MPETQRRRPPLLELSRDANDVMMRIVSPITPAMMSEEMRNTVRLSQTIRQQQNSLIAAKQDLLSASTRELDSDRSSNDKSPQTELSAESRSPQPAISKAVESPVIIVASPPSTVTVATPTSESGKPDSDEEFLRLANTLAEKRLKRKAPGPLQLASGHIHHPAINSAPLRSYRRAMPRYVQTVPYPMQCVPYTAIPMTPYRRVMPKAAQLAQRPRKERKRPVLDVFHGDITRTAPMPSQPPSAQLEHFEQVPSDDRSEATEEEMREMEQKSKDAHQVFGSISFMNQSVFNFKIFGNKTDEERKEKFMKICETTWDEYVAKGA